MSVETAIRARLVADATVGGLVSTRVYPLILPQSPTYPAITYNRVSGVRVHDLGLGSDRATPRISIYSWAKSTASDAGYDIAQTLADAVRECLDGFSGTVGGVTIDSIRIDNELPLFEQDAALKGAYRILQDYFVSHRE